MVGYGIRWAYVGIKKDVRIWLGINAEKWIGDGRAVLNGSECQSGGWYQSERSDGFLVCDGASGWVLGGAMGVLEAIGMYPDPPYMVCQEITEPWAPMCAHMCQRLTGCMCPLCSEIKWSSLFRKYVFHRCPMVNGVQKLFDLSQQQCVYPKRRTKRTPGVPSEWPLTFSTLHTNGKDANFFLGSSGYGEACYFNTVRACI